ncbi:MAG: hypothetical protein ACLTX3_08075 [Lachnospiraceae bacterium]
MTKQEETELRNVLVGLYESIQENDTDIGKEQSNLYKRKNALQDTAAGWERIYILFRRNSVRCEGRDEQF